MVSGRRGSDVHPPFYLAVRTDPGGFSQVSFHLPQPPNGLARRSERNLGRSDSQHACWVLSVRAVLPGVPVPGCACAEAVGFSLVVTGATLVVTGALLVVTKSY